MAGHGYLFAQLVRRELRQKYKGSALGVLWYVVNPLVLMGAYTLMFGFVFKLQTIADFPIFLMVGLVLWTFFQQSLLAAADSLILPCGAEIFIISFLWASSSASTGGFCRRSPSPPTAQLGFVHGFHASDVRGHRDRHACRQRGGSPALVGFARDRRARARARPTLDRRRGPAGRRDALVPQQVPAAMFQIRDWANRLPRSASVRVDIPPGGMQLWAVYMLGHHRVDSATPVLHTTYAHASGGLRADCALSLRYHPSADARVKLPYPPQLFAQSQPLLENGVVVLRKIDWPARYDNVPDTASTKLIEP